MDKESANWCRIAHTIMQKGGEVLRQFLVSEILTQSFDENSRYWMENVHNFSKSSLSVHHTRLMFKSTKPRDRILDNLLQSWKVDPTDQVILMEQIEWFKQCKNDIENEHKNSISGSVNKTFESWLEYIDNEIQALTKIKDFVFQLNEKFHDHLKNSQSSLLLEIEKNDGFMSRCSHKLRSLSMSSSCEFQQLVQNFKTELNSWKEECLKIFQGFINKCQNTIAEGLINVKRITNGYGIERFLYRFQATINDCNLESQVDKFCDEWDDGLHKVFDIYERKIQEDDSPDALLRLTQRLCAELENRSSFKETKIIRFFHSFKLSNIPEFLQKQCSNLNKISRSSELNQLDLTILMTTLRYGNLVHSMPKQCDDDQRDWDKSIRADVGRLRVHRNTIVGHIAQLRIPNEEFDKLWEDVTTLLHKIASRCDEQFNMNIGCDIEKMKYCSLEPDREYELQREFLTWCKKDILAQLSGRSTAASKCLEMLQSIQAALEKLARRRQACTCRICNNEFSTESELAEHMQRHQDCRCLSCKKTFLTDSMLTNHMKSHQDRVCSRCKMACSTEWEFRRHMWCNQECKCGGCDETFPSEREFEEHIAHHKALKCSICKMGYPTESELCEHMLFHLARTCLSCKKDFPNEKDFEQHMRSHEARTCRRCKKNFSMPFELENHMKCHPDRTCRSCNMDFSTEIELDVHMMYHQDRTCRICSKEFTTVTELEEHMKYHLAGTNPAYIHGTTLGPVLFSAAEKMDIGEVADAN